MISTKSALWLVLASAGTLPAQGVTLEATALSELRVSTTSYVWGFPNTNTDTVPAGTDITNGADLNSSSANLSLATQFEPWGIVVRLNESARGRAFTLGSVTNSDVGRHQIQVELSSPRPMRARLTVRHCMWRSDSTFITDYQGQVDIAGVGSVSSGASCDDPTLQTFDVLIDSTPLVAVITSEGFARGSQSGFPTSMQGFWQLELVPDPTFPCEIEAYGTPCGATLTAISDFLHPGQHVITLEDPSRPPVAILGLGTQRQAVPIVGGCVLYHDLLVLVPWNIDPTGKAVLVFDPPGIPGLTFKAQAATLQGGTLHTTNALDVVCR